MNKEESMKVNIDKDKKMNKENVKVPIRSKIPLPVEPLPPLSESVLTKPYKIKVERHPLETIYQQASNEEDRAESLKYRIKSGHLKKYVKKERNTLDEIDNRHVTLRPKNEDLDWNFNVFNDNTNVKDANDVNANEIQNDCLGESIKVTPVPGPSLESSRAKKIKKSLKRPHSRELQGISPRIPNDKKEEKHIRRLNFADRKDVTTSDDYWINLYANYINDQYAEFFLSYLLDKERIPTTPRISISTRICLINWIIKVHGPCGNPAVIQTATWYFDAILNVSEVSVEKLQLVAAACYWISLKIHGGNVSAKKIVKMSDNAFSVKLLSSADKAVMRKLQFPLPPIVPQEFMSYWSWICCSCNYVEIEIAATIVCIAGLMIHKALCNQYPSVLGAAAIRNALLLLSKKNLLEKLEANSTYTVARKKTSKFACICALQREALRTMAQPLYDYKVLLEQYDAPIVQKIISSVTNDYASMDQEILLDYSK